MQNYARVRKLGEGGFGQVFLVRDKRDNEEYVMKVVDLSKLDAKGRADAIREAEYLKTLKHPNIIGYQEYFKLKSTQQTRYGAIPVEKLYIVMQYADDGDLESKIKERQPDKYFTEDQILDWFVQMALALKHLHDRKILHRDIKSQNVFLMKGSGIAKLGDFGIAKSLNSTRAKARTMIGTPFYLSPEICKESAYDHKSDIWSLGVVLYELLALHHPFQANNMKDLLAKICNSHPPPPPAHYSRALRLLLAKMLDKDPTCRPSVNELLASPLIRNRISKYLSANALREEFSHTVLHAGGVIRRALPQGLITQLVNQGANGASDEGMTNVETTLAPNQPNVVVPGARARIDLGAPGRQVHRGDGAASKPPLPPQSSLAEEKQIDRKAAEMKAVKDQQELIARHLAELKKKNEEIEARARAKEKAEAEARRRALLEMEARAAAARKRQEMQAQREQEAQARREAIKQMREERLRNKMQNEASSWSEQGQEIQIFEGRRDRNANREALQEAAMRGWMKEKQDQEKERELREREREQREREREQREAEKPWNARNADAPERFQRPIRGGGAAGGDFGIMIYEGRRPAASPTPVQPASPSIPQSVSPIQRHHSDPNASVSKPSPDMTPNEALTYEQQLALIRAQNRRDQLYMRAVMQARQLGLPEPTREEFERGKVQSSASSADSRSPSPATPSTAYQQDKPEANASPTSPPAVRERELRSDADPSRSPPVKPAQRPSDTPDEPLILSPRVSTVAMKKLPPSRGTYIAEPNPELLEAWEQYMENRKARTATPVQAATPSSAAGSKPRTASSVSTSQDTILPPEALALLSRLEEQEQLIEKVKAQRSVPGTNSGRTEEASPTTPGDTESDEVNEDYIDPVVASLDVAEDVKPPKEIAQPVEPDTTDASQELRRLERGADEFVAHMRNLRALLSNLQVELPSIVEAAEPELKANGKPLYVPPPPQSADVLLQNAYCKYRTFYDRRTHQPVAYVEDDGFITDTSGTVIGYLTPQQRRKRKVPPNAPLPEPPKNASPSASAISKPSLPLPQPPSSASVQESPVVSVGVSDDMNAEEYLKGRKARPEVQQVQSAHESEQKSNPSLEPEPEPEEESSIVLNVELDDTADLDSLEHVDAQKDREDEQEEGDVDDVDLSQTSVCVRLLGVTGSSGLTMKPVRHDAGRTDDVYISDDSFADDELLSKFAFE